MLGGLGQQRESKKVFKEIMAENLPNLGKGINLQIQAQMKPKQGKSKEIHTRTLDNQTSEN